MFLKLFLAMLIVAPEPALAGPRDPWPPSAAAKAPRPAPVLQEDNVISRRTATLRCEPTGPHNAIVCSHDEDVGQGLSWYLHWSSPWCRIQAWPDA